MNVSVCSHVGHTLHLPPSPTLQSPSLSLSCTPSFFFLSSSFLPRLHSITPLPCLFIPPSLAHNHSSSLLLHSSLAWSPSFLPRLHTITPDRFSSFTGSTTGFFQKSKALIPPFTFGLQARLNSREKVAPRTR